jgi:hypothetical protein
MGFFSNISMSTKMASSTILAVCGIVGGVWAFDDRYIDQDEIVASLTGYDKQIQQRITNLERDGMYRDYLRLTERYYQLRHQLAENPNNMELREELEWVKSQRVILIQQLGL